jgi:mono/diheme cytochrome c family protein
LNRGWQSPLVAFALAVGVGAAISTALARGEPRGQVILDLAPGSSTPPTEKTLPRGEGRSLLERRCGVCHSLGLVMQQRLSPEAWKNEVKKMRGWGAFMDDDEAAKITELLGSSLGKDGPLYVPGHLDAREADAPTRREAATGPRGDLAKGAELYKVNCAPCHGASAEGARGPALRSRPIATQPLRFASLVRSGRGDMPGYPTFDDAAIADLFAFASVP